jgi:acylphosphatase
MTQEMSGRSSRLHAVVHGYVQGVGFRFFARREALLLSLCGYVRNQADGSVEVVVEGRRRQLETYLARLQRGPSEAEVDWVDQVWSQASGDFTDFQIRH